MEKIKLLRFCGNNGIQTDSVYTPYNIIETVKKIETAIGPCLWLGISASFLTNFDQITGDEKVC